MAVIDFENRVTWIKHNQDTVRSRMASAAQRVGRDVDDVMLVAVTKLQSSEVTRTWDETRWQELIPPFAEISQMTNISAQGLMCMTPFFSDPETSHPHYRKLRKFQKFLMVNFRGRIGTSCQSAPALIISLPLKKAQR